MQTQPIPAVTRYFGDRLIPEIALTYKPGQPWRTYPFHKRVSRSWLRKLKAEGITWVALRHPDGRVADFTVTELLRTP